MCVSQYALTFASQPAIFESVLISELDWEIVQVPYFRLRMALNYVVYPDSFLENQKPASQCSFWIGPNVVRRVIFNYC